MKIFIMTDMEGVAGVLNHDDWCVPGARYYDTGRKFLTLELNAAIKGFFDAGADEVLVADGHGWGGVDIELLDRRALLQRGFPGPYPFGLDKSFDAVAWVGQHPKSGTEMGHICHTGSFGTLDYRINGISVGEFGQLCLCAEELGVAPVFASGCQAFAREALALVPGIQTAVVKYGLTPGSGDELDPDKYGKRNLAAVHRHPEKARELIYSNAKAALRRFKEDPTAFAPAVVKAPFVVEAEYRGRDGSPGAKSRREHPESLIACLNS